MLYTAMTGTIINMHARGRHTYALLSSIILEASLQQFCGSVLTLVLVHLVLLATLLSVHGGSWILDLAVTCHNYLSNAMQCKAKQSKAKFDITEWNSS